MKRIINILSYFILAFFIFLVVNTMYIKIKKWVYSPDEKSSSFVGYSQSCWQVGDTLHVVTAKGDTVRLDVSKLNQQ